MTLPENAISIQDAAKILGLAPITVRKNMREGRIKGVKIKKCWFVDLDSLKEFINRNGTTYAHRLEINGEKAVRLADFAKSRGITSINSINRAINDNLLNVVMINHVRFITESEIKRYDRRFKERFGRKIICIEDAAKKLGRTVERVQEHIAENELETVVVEKRLFVYKDSLDKLEERLQAGEYFLAIPKNGKVRRELPTNET